MVYENVFLILLGLWVFGMLSYMFCNYFPALKKHIDNSDIAKHASKIFLITSYVLFGVGVILIFIKNPISLYIRIFCFVLSFQFLLYSLLSRLKNSFLNNNIHEGNEKRMNRGYKK